MRKRQSRCLKPERCLKSLNSFRRDPKADFRPTEEFFFDWNIEIQQIITWRTIFEKFLIFLLFFSDFSALFFDINF